MLEDNPVSELGPRLPQWWNDQIDASWQRSRAAAVSDWIHFGVRPADVSQGDTAIDEHALSFGHGARSAFPSCTTWGAVAPQLRADWIRLGNVGPAAWDHVAHIIRHEWQRAGGPDGDAAAAPSTPA